MLQITIPGTEMFNEETNEFFTTKDTTLQLEHSLVSLSKWEAKWNTPFLGKEKKTIEQTIDYIKCMTITQNVNPIVYLNLTDANITAINDYIDEPMTATTFSNLNTPPSREIVTSELIYYWMIALNIPMECQKWHLNRLLTLIRVCNVKNTPPKKMSRQEIMNRNAALNAARRKKLNSKG
ncbi:hypothetical protein [uncultured Eubacterium sp.]|uniref:hypothetical protein n=1 Tax=uncultured Eubacterium sp. TaxID=165185 RepID=UPI00259277AA|nr:hypothetical protein [uncultured Eubacterium sp.]